jgi:hypothetical protein
MTDLAPLLAQVRETSTAQRSAEHTGSLPANAETASVLELGDRRDSVAFLTAVARRGVFNVTPARHADRSRLPTPLSQKPWWNARPPNWWLDRFVRQSPHWVYFSGHFDGVELWNQNFSFVLNFDAPTAENNPLWRRYEERATSGYVLGAQCECVLIVGCNALIFPTALGNIQAMLTGGAGAPVILGFQDSCPTERTFATSELCRHFVDALDRDWERRHEAGHIADSWLEAGRRWSASVYGRRLAYCDSAGNRFGVRRSGPFTWQVL